MAYQNKFTIQYKESEQLKFTEENMKEVQHLSTNIQVIQQQMVVIARGISMN